MTFSDTICTKSTFKIAVCTQTVVAKLKINKSKPWYNLEKLPWRLTNTRIKQQAWLFRCQNTPKRNNWPKLTLKCYKRNPGGRLTVFHVTPLRARPSDKRLELFPLNHRRIWWDWIIYCSLYSTASSLRLNRSQCDFTQPYSDLQVANALILVKQGYWLKAFSPYRIFTRPLSFLVIKPLKQKFDKLFTKINWFQWFYTLKTQKYK